MTATPHHRLRLRAEAAEQPWQHGLLDHGQWSATWIEPIEPPGTPERRRPAYLLAGDLHLDAEVEAATLHATAHGIYEVFVNGARVGDHELTPGFTAYRRRLQVHSFDVTALLAGGANTLGAVLSDGWWRGQNGFVRRVDDYGPTTAFLAQLDVTFRSGAAATFATDATWRSSPSHILAADLIAGEVHDLRRRVAGWAEPGTDRSRWSPVRVADHGYDRLVAVVGPPVRRVEELAPVSVDEVAPGRWVVDFGQNSNGWVRLGGLGPAGTETTLTHGEALDAAGDVTQAHLDVDLNPVASSVPFQVDTVVSAGVDGDVFEPRHSTKGFRYVRVEGYHGALRDDAIRSVVVHSDLERRGSFRCSDGRLEALHRAAEWSFRGNACDIPTDCPTRERSGWTGDWQIYVDTAAYLYDVHAFSVKWLRDLSAEQFPNGAVTNLVPEPHPMDADRLPPFWREMVGAAGWGDAAVHVPWELYRATGDREVLEQQWPSMRAWVEYAAGAAASGRHATRIERSPSPAEHERYLWDTGFHFGEWLEPGDDLRRAIDVALSADHGATATAYLHRSASELAEIARITGRAADAERYAHLAGDVRRAWQTAFVDDGRIVPRTQATIARALAFGLVPDDAVPAAVADLVALVREAGTHLGTGFLTTPFLLPVLADHGQVDLAYELLLRSTEPSWLLMLERGATTIWEEWGGVAADGTASGSLNHYSKGAVISFLHRYVAGLQLLEPGYRRFRVAPRPGGGVTSAATHHDAPPGRVEVAWQLDAGEWCVDVTVPPGATGELVLPDGTTDVLAAGTHRRTWLEPR